MTLGLKVLNVYMKWRNLGLGKGEVTKLNVSIGEKHHSDKKKKKRKWAVK